MGQTSALGTQAGLMHAIFIDYERLNSLTVRNHYLIPRMDDILDSLGRAKVFSALEANSGYCKMVFSDD